MGAGRLHAAGAVWHPAGLPSAGWLVIAAIALVAVGGLHATAPMAERFLRREGIVVDEVPPAEEGEIAAVPSLT